MKTSGGVDMIKKKKLLLLAVPVVAAAAGYAAVKVIKKQHEKKNYLCPHCGEVFKPGILEFCFGKKKHGRKTLVCPVCGQKGACEETLIFANENIDYFGN